MGRSFHPATAACLLVLAWAGCSGGGGSIDTGPDYDQRVAAAWADFSAGEFDAALAGFDEAAVIDETRADAWVGRGWVKVRTAEPAAASDAFETAAPLTGTTAVRADLFAGWAFATGAEADPSGASTAAYTSSNARADSALALDAAWDLEFAPAIDHDDLRVLQAENYFLLGNYDASLAIVQIYDPPFTVITSTPEGQAALSSRIEELALEHMSLGRHLAR